jgi:hypothetical protein
MTSVGSDDDRLKAQYAKLPPFKRNKVAVGLSSIVAEVREQEATRQKPDRAPKQ